jgi:hypothetical protein
MASPAEKYANLRSGKTSKNAKDKYAQLSGRKGGDSGVLGDIGGFFGNLGGDIAGAATGFPMGVATLGEDIYNAAKDPRKAWMLTPGGLPILLATSKTGRGMAEGYKRQYGMNPLSRKFWEQQYKHPLQPIVDTLGVLGLGAGAATKVGLLKIPARQQMLRTPGGELIPGKVMSQRPLMRGAQVIGEKVSKKIPPGTRIVGEYSKAAKELKRPPEIKHAAGVLKAHPYLKAYGKLNNRERVALAILGRVPLPEHFAAWKAQLPKNAPIHTVLNDSKIVRLYERPSEKMLKAHEAGAALGEESAAILKRLGALGEKAAADRPYLHSRLMSGGKFELDLDAMKGLDDADFGGGAKPDALFGDEFGAASVDDLGFGRGVWVRPFDRDNLGRITFYDPESGHARVKFYNRGTGLRAERDFHRDDLRLASEGEVSRSLPVKLTGGKSVDELKAEIAASGDPNALPPVPKGRVRVYRGQGETGPIDPNEVGDLVAMQRGGWFSDNPEVAREYAKRSGGKLHYADVDEDWARAFSRQRESDAGQRWREYQFPDTVRERLGLEAREVPGRAQPIYMRDTALEDKVGGSGFSGGGGLGVTKSPVKQSRGVLFQIGQIATSKDVIGPSYFRTLKYQFHREIGDALVTAGVKVPVGHGLPADHVWKRRGIARTQRTSDGDTYVTMKPERIGYVETTKGQFKKEVDELADELDVEDLEDVGESVTNESFTTDLDVEAEVFDGPQGRYRIAVPKRFAQEVTGEFRRVDNMTRILIQNPTRFWRALVLNARPAWLINNMIGNSLLFTMSLAGEGGIKAAAKRAVRKGDLTDADFAELFPEHTQAGTMLGTQAPSAGKFGKATQIMGLGLAPVDKAFEAFLRKSGVEGQLRNAPAVRARLEAMPVEARSFREAARAELKENPMLQREVSQKVNDALGDYFSMSDFERRYVRSLLPFYGWYRAITTIMVKYPLNHPVRAAILTNLGRIGDERSRDLLGPVPSYLRGSIPLGDNEILKTQGLNPLATPPTLGRAIGHDVGGMGVNPIVAGLARTFGKKMPWEDPYSLFDAPGNVWASAGASLPPVRLAESAGVLPHVGYSGGSLNFGLTGRPESRLYEDSGLWPETKQFFGFPKRRLNRTRAEQLAREGK